MDETTRALAEALLSAVKTLTAERDCQYDCCTTADGRYTDPDDERQIAEWDAEIDGYKAALQQAGYLTDDTTGRVKQVCVDCLSDGVSTQAWARWDFATQRWVVDEIIPGIEGGKSSCGPCGGETEIVEVAA